MRRAYLDNIRTMTVVLVVIYHVVFLFNGITVGVVGPFSPVQPQDALMYVLYPWFMVLLFLVAGMSARFALETQYEREFIRGRTRKLLIPSTVGLFAFHWIQGLVNMRIAGAFDRITGVPKPVVALIVVASGIGVLWFIQMLWLFSVLLIPIRHLEKGRLTGICEKMNCAALAAMGVAAWASAQVLNTPVVAVYRFGIYGFCFLMGYFVFSRDAVMERLAHNGVWFAAASVPLGVAYVVRSFGMDFSVAPNVNSLLAMAYMWSTCLGILGCMKRWGDRRTAFGEWVRRRSWGLYVLHYLPMSVCAMLLKEVPILSPVCIYLATLIAGFLGAFLLEAVIRRIPVLRLCVLGISGEKNAL